MSLVDKSWQARMAVRFAVWQLLRDGTWWKERQKIKGGH